MMSKDKSETPADKARAQESKRGENDNELDDALDATFPASDPVTVGDVTGDEPTNVRKDRRAPKLDEALVDRLARELKEDSRKD